MPFRDTIKVRTYLVNNRVTSKLLDLDGALGIFLVDDSQTAPLKKGPFTKIDFLDVSDDF